VSYLVKESRIIRENSTDCEKWSLLLRQIGVKRMRMGIFGNRLYSEINIFVFRRTDRQISNY
jgi:hypothetical protein